MKAYFEGANQRQDDEILSKHLEIRDNLSIDSATIGYGDESLQRDTGVRVAGLVMNTRTFNLILSAVHIGLAFVPSYLDPGNGFQANSRYDPVRDSYLRSEVSVEDSLDAGNSTEDIDVFLLISHIIQGAITNLNGDDRYPVEFETPIRVFLDVTSVAPRRNNYDMCADNPSCPLSPGRQVLEFTLDPMRLINRFFRMIHNDMVLKALFLAIAHILIII
ncbi:unnamed protein product [Strongylus vulgaris]|uniref:Uncharacterized protein n=1 Tax=Strongylus vulgaris TaxID=40348 RepID=A0A3P7ISJ5_STRVU|nr:unnamed protein product [Strongylus vulgaris]